MSVSLGDALVVCARKAVENDDDVTFAYATVGHFGDAPRDIALKSTHAGSVLWKAVLVIILEASADVCCLDVDRT